jgi:predicted phosphohydrolase
LNTRDAGNSSTAQAFPNEAQRLVKIVCLSDTHGFHRKVHVPPGDLLIHAGDFTLFSRSQAEILDFNAWLGELPHRYKIVIPGNHEFAFETPRFSRVISNAVFLIDEAVEAGGFRVWGSPMTTLYGGAFGRSAAADRARVYSGIPEGTDILVTHGPPFGVLDRPRGTDRNDGCQELLAAVTRIKPALHIFGHVHGGYGSHRANGTVFVNAALCGESEGIEQQPIVVDLEPRQLAALRKQL